MIAIVLVCEAVLVLGHLQNLLVDFHPLPLCSGQLFALKQILSPYISAGNVRSSCSDCYRSIHLYIHKYIHTYPLVPQTLFQQYKLLFFSLLQVVLPGNLSQLIQSAPVNIAAVYIHGFAQCFYHPQFVPCVRNVEVAGGGRSGVIVIVVEVVVFTGDTRSIVVVV